MDRGATFHRRGESANFSPIAGNKIIIYASFEVGDDRMDVAAGATLLLSPGGVIAHAIANKRHCVIEQARRNDLTHLPRLTCGPIIAQYLDYARRGKNMHAATGALHCHTYGFALSVVVVCGTLKV